MLQRCPIAYFKDVVRALIKLANEDINSIPTRIYNLSGIYPAVAAKDLAEKIIKQIPGASLAFKPDPGSIYTKQSLDFKRTVYIGDTITARVEVLELLTDKNRIKMSTVCRNQRGETVIDGVLKLEINEAVWYRLNNFFLSLFITIIAYLLY